jgi:predicted ATP-grasp superfamily ATP-dependent carboligase
VRRVLAGVPRADFRDRPPPDLDVKTPALVLKIGHYPLHHGGLGAARSLARAGVPTSAITEDRFTPLALCRYVEPIVWPTSGDEPPEALLERLVQIGARQPAKTLLVCTDDRAAVLVAEGHEGLDDYFLRPLVPRGLPRLLASKRNLYELCVRHGVPTPNTLFPQAFSDLDDVSEQLSYPVVVKNAELFLAPAQPRLGWTTLVRAREDLRRLAARWEEPFSVLVQEYLPNESSADWVVHGYCNAASEASVVFSGLKLQASPPFGNATALGLVRSDSGLISLATGFCRSIGYRGCFDLDWRQDLRDGTFRLVDFNPRIGAQFRLFENDAGVDVVRAMHLDLSGRPVPPGRPVEGDRLVVENLQLGAKLSHRWSPTRGTPLVATTDRSTRPRGAWTAADDPLPAVSLAARQLGGSARSVVAPRVPR